jgi:antibiotic biosynthesis monooxygenase (ABM) superfamily enzyme
MSWEAELRDEAAGAVTATVTRRVKPGHEAAYEQFLYKMAILTWVTIVPLITLAVLASAPLIGPWPLVPRLAVTTAVTVAVMTWVVMPRVTRLLRRWLYPGRR